MGREGLKPPLFFVSSASSSPFFFVVLCSSLPCFSLFFVLLACFSNCLHHLDIDSILFCLVWCGVSSLLPHVSWPQSGAGYRTTEEQIGGDMDAFYVQFFARYPFLSGGLYLTGEVNATRRVERGATIPAQNHTYNSFILPQIEIPHENRAEYIKPYISLLFSRL